MYGMTGLPFMGYVALLLLGFGVIAYLIGLVLMLVASFRRHLGWGLATLLLPGAALIFTLLHWAEARRGFLLQVMGVIVLFVGSMAANDGGASQFARSMMGAGSNSQSENSEAMLRAKESELRTAEQELGHLQGKLNSDYESLTKRRATAGTDQATLAAFNEDAATYASEKTLLSVKAGRVAQLRADVVRLTDQVFLEAREAAKTKSNSKPVFATSQRQSLRAEALKPVTVKPGDVVMYSTRRCPACVKAKQYFASRGVSYTEIDVESDPKGREEFDKRGGHAVPMIVVKGKQMVGFNQGELEKLL